jgi:6-phosphofructokinase 1
MVALKNNDIIPVPLAEVAGKLKLVGPKDPLVLKAIDMGTNFGI